MATIEQARKIKNLIEAANPDLSVGINGNKHDGYGVTVRYDSVKPVISAQINGVPIKLEKRHPVHKQ